MAIRGPLSNNKSTLAPVERITLERMEQEGLALRVFRSRYDGGDQVTYQGAALIADLDTVDAEAVYESSAYTAISLFERGLIKVISREILDGEDVIYYGLVE